MRILDTFKKKHDEYCDKTATKMTKWIGNGGWITICVLGGLGVLLAFFGMVIHLIEFAKGDVGTFIAMLFIALIVWGAAGLGIYGIVKIIKHNRELFNY